MMTIDVQYLRDHLATESATGIGHVKLNIDLWHGFKNRWRRNASTEGVPLVVK
jgi:hypothetical protein